VSGDFRQHSVAHFIAPVIARHDRAQYLVYCYSNIRPERHDAMTRRLREAADLWRDVAALSDHDLATFIAADGIDILVDLSGHTSGNRLGAFAHRSAPVQMSWIGYPDTTGLPAMDYRLTDAWADPVGEADDRATETLLRIPDGFLCYSPSPDTQGTPECSPPPHELNGFVTFGSLNNLAKINDSVVACWSAILRSVPASCLLLKGAALADARVRERIARRFGEHGVEASRLELLTYTASTADHLACYRRVDIALDTFPYNGTTTTCEALWMGVPVVTFTGHTHASRVGLSLLQRIGLAEFAVDNLDDYAARAIALANDGPRLATLHASLRERMRASPLMDNAGFCARLENCYRQAWQQWCEKAD
jgi:predicted O-linked N-acetylglucosamine transferase (SPINDLY family)